MLCSAWTAGAGRPERTGGRSASLPPNGRSPGWCRGQRRSRPVGSRTSRTTSAQRLHLGACDPLRHLVGRCSAPVLASRSARDSPMAWRPAELLAACLGGRVGGEQVQGVGGVTMVDRTQEAQGDAVALCQRVAGGQGAAVRGRVAHEPVSLSSMAHMGPPSWPRSTGRVNGQPDLRRPGGATRRRASRSISPGDRGGHRCWRPKGWRVGLRSAQ